MTLRDAAPLFLRTRRQAMLTVKHSPIAHWVNGQLSRTAYSGCAACRLLDEMGGHWRFPVLRDPRLLIVTDLVTDMVQGRGRWYRDDGVAGIAAGCVTVRLPEAPRQLQLPTCGSANRGRPGMSR